MSASEGQLLKLGPWPSGANNLAAETSVPRTSFREGVNVKVADDGKVSRTEGYSKLLNAVEPHSLFATGYRVFFADVAALYGAELGVDGVLTTPEALYSALRVDEPLAYCLIEPDLYVSDGQIALRVSPDNTVAPWALPTPPTPVTNGALLGGAMLPEGRYLVALAYRAATGEESGLSTVLTLDNPGGQPVIAFPPAPAGVSRTLVYLTKPNGTDLLLSKVLPPSATSVALGDSPLGRSSPTNGLEAMPAGRFAAYFAGRLLVAVNDLVVFSEPMQYGLTAPDYNFIPLSEPVTGLGTIGETLAGFFVGQLSRTYFARGENPTDARLEEVYPAGMVPGTLTHVPGSRLPMDAPPAVPVPVWLATNGVICVGLPDGTVYPLTEARYAADVGDAGASVLVQRDGVSRLLVTTRNPSENVLAVGDSVSIEVIRNGA